MNSWEEPTATLLAKGSPPGSDLRRIRYPWSVTTFPLTESSFATFGVLSVARRLRPEIGICTITPDGGITTLASGLRIVADHDIGTAPRLDVLVVTGGPGWVAQSRSVATLDFIRRHAASTLIVSVCTGGMILAASGTLDGRAATTKSRAGPPEVSPLHRMHNDHP